MNDMLWIEQRFANEGFEVPSELKQMLSKNDRDQPPFFFLHEAAGRRQDSSVKRQFPSRTVFPFARRGDDDGIICLVLSDPVYPRGSVLVVHDYGHPGYEIDDDYPSLAAWAKSAENDIEEWAKPAEPKP